MQRRSTRSSCKKIIEEERRENNTPKRTIISERDDEDDDYEIKNEKEAFIAFTPNKITNMIKYFFMFLMILPWVSMISRNAIYSQIFPKVKTLIEESFTCPESPNIICPVMNVTCPICPVIKNITSTPNKASNKEEEKNKETDF
jgi:hypothetical protein